MPRTLSDKGLALLGRLPAYHHGDPNSQAVQDALGRELQRVEDMVTEVVLRFAFPHLAQDDAYGSLAYWERLLELPLVPDGVPVEERRAKVLASFRKRHAARGSDWIELMDTAIGSTLWDHQEGPAAYTIVVTLPQASGTYTAVEVNKLARKWTPAHLALSYSTGEGFVLSYSALGSAHL